MKNIQELEKVTDDSLKLLLKGLNPSKAKKMQLLEIMELMGFMEPNTVKSLEIPEISKQQILEKFGYTYNKQVLPVLKQLIDGKRCKLLLEAKKEEAANINVLLDSSSRTEKELLKLKDGIIEKVLSVDSTKADIIKTREQVVALRQQVSNNKNNLKEIIDGIKLAARQELRIKGLID